MELTPLKLGLAPEMAEMINNAGEAADFLKKLAHPSRLMIVCALVKGELSVRELENALGIRQPGLSQQIAELREAGFITGRKVSKNMFYRLQDGRVNAFVSMLHSMFCEVPQPTQTGIDP
ncbi:metalloregulator ArsR/SmtB family transcription factor [Mesorhizobium sp. NBSH29]|uniref:ArsR/SmtB family transcription factor n=1 Tax=Mesorhizobium sp. NBSH29 TaxID=2654249 RepID=UPI00189675C8|nr:metalloregulator ArsR/SmtB family transcription factor [Mesorhizobium sp. NBSH29]QPC86938.1 metalloregulator ArsR/SmtB family transcription factor [Mesorhizobium sp. NBSH29]